ncbi:hypothetical protein [Promicromonospora panici]|uniref:hypothetical protein n=1 Tax=Promicromonospora panici TaxID=2219658 RepID=UPI001A9358FC|nr:hypothetical protein [Promicromonospora panici]
MTTDEHVELADELLRLIERRIVDPLEILFGSDEQVRPVRDQLRIETEVWAAQLLVRDDKLAVHTAARLVAALFPGDGPFDPPDAWWPGASGTRAGTRCRSPRRGRCWASPGRASTTWSSASSSTGIPTAV